MHARLVTFNMGPGKRDVAIGLADGAMKIVKEMDGFVRATYLILDEEAGDYGSLTVWESEAHANAANETLLPWLAKESEGHMIAPPVIRLAEVHEPA